MTEPQQLEAVVRCVAAHGVGTNPQVQWPPRPLEDGNWQTFLSRISAERLEGFLQAAVAGGFPVTDEQAAELDDTHEVALGLSLRLERLLLAVVETLGERAIECYVLKGPALARLLYPDPAVRLFGDVDILVRAADYTDACDAISAKGLTRAYPEPRPGWDRRFTKGTVFRADGMEIDLHRTLALGPYGLSVQLDDLFVDPATFELAGTTLLALAPDKRLLHACFHAALGDIPPRLVPLRDVAQALVSDFVDPVATLELAARWRASAVVARAVHLAASTLDLSDLPMAGWAEAFRPDRRDRIAMFAYTDPNRNSPKQAVLSLLGIRGVSAKAAYLRGLIVPQASYLEGRHSDNSWSRWRYALRSLMAHGRRP
jgi:hypothetical protein